MEPGERQQFLSVLAIDSVSSMGSEISAICVATAFKIIFYQHRVRWDFGYAASTQPNASVEIQTAAFALLLEAICDVTAIFVQTRQGEESRPVSRLVPTFVCKL